MKTLKKVLTLGCTVVLLTIFYSNPTTTLAQQPIGGGGCLDVGYPNYYHDYECCTWPEGIYCGTMNCPC